MENTRPCPPRTRPGTRTLDLIAGARPNFVKIAPIIRALEAAAAAGGPLRYRLVHTGQHHDRAMSGSFFEELGIPDPHVNLGVGPGTQAEQTGQIMARYEAAVGVARPDLCLVVGDVTSTMACAVTARKLGVPVAHVEAGIRSGDWSMPEEVNRVVTDAVSNWFFTTSETANAHLRASGVPADRIHFVGNTMIDTLLAHWTRLRPSPVVASLSPAPSGYLVLTLHRPANVDDPARFGRLLGAIASHAGGMPVVFPVHPRTARVLATMGGLPSCLHRVEPMPYLEFMDLVRGARAVLTDSGGLTEEATVMGIPCMTLRDHTERPETVTVGTNELVGADGAGLASALGRLRAGEWKRGGIPERWDGQASRRIVEALESVLG